MQAFPGQLPLDMLSWFLCFAIIVQLQILGRNIIQGYVVLLEIRTDMVPVVAGISLKCDPVNLVLLLLQPCLKPLPEWSSRIGYDFTFFKLACNLLRCSLRLPFIAPLYGNFSRYPFLFRFAVNIETRNSRR